MSKQISVGSKVKTIKGTEGTIAEVLEGGYLLENGKRIRTQSIAQVLEPPPKPTGLTFHLGDRVTLFDKYQVRAADVGTVEAITEKGIQVLWDNKSPHEPNLKQPPILWRTFRPDELELVERKYQQN